MKILDAVKKYKILSNPTKMTYCPVTGQVFSENTIHSKLSYV